MLIMNKHLINGEARNVVEYAYPYIQLVAGWCMDPYVRLSGTVFSLPTQSKAVPQFEFRPSAISDKNYDVNCNREMKA